MTDHDQLLARADKLRRSGRVRVDGSLAYALADALRAATTTRPESLYEGTAGSLRYGKFPWSPFTVDQRVVVYAAAGSATPTQGDCTGCRMTYAECVSVQLPAIRCCPECHHPDAVAGSAARPEPHPQPRNLAGEVTPWPWEHPDTSEVWDWAYREGYRAGAIQPEPGEILRRILNSWPLPYSDIITNPLQAILDEEGPEALVQAVLTAVAGSATPTQGALSEATAETDENCERDHATPTNACSSTHAGVGRGVRWRPACSTRGT